MPCHIPATWRCDVRASLPWEAGGRFEILEVLGEGGSGAVYRARDTATGDVVALKQLRRARPDEVARFKREFRTLSELHHANLVSVRELIEHAGSWFISMDFVEGHGLLEHLRGRAAGAHTKAPAQGAPLSAVLAPFLDLARGLCALHESGAVHRDVKPDNVRITPRGRAVLIDLGLVTRSDPRLQSSHQGGLGTAAYMAPEQASGVSVQAAADWYAFGTSLFEALTGELPFTATSSFEYVRQKQTQVAPRLSSLRPDVPPQLDALCAELLRRDPEARPQGPAVLARLETICPVSQVRVRPPTPSPSSAPSAPPFTGRTTELDQLHAELRRACGGELRCVWIEGASGVGKTALLQQFLRDLRGRADLHVLSGRCYENEHVPFKAFDEPVEQLARHLRALPHEECARLLPPDVSLLPQVLPAFQQVEAIASSPPGRHASDPTARRLGALGAMTELWARLADQRPVVLTLDDLQWADAESFDMLAALARRPQPPPMLVVATLRPRDARSPQALDDLTQRAQSRLLQLPPLSTREARDLAQALLAARGDDQLDAIARGSGGHPMLLLELVHFAELHPRVSPSALTLTSALAARLDHMDPESRELLELLALAARPLPPSVLARCADAGRGISLEALEDRLRPLRVSKLLRRTHGRETTYAHDSIREVTVEAIDSGRRRALHARLAEAMNDPSELAERAEHWAMAGATAEAAAAYDEASEQAMRGLAFARAASLCTRALSLMADDDPRRGPLLTRLGEAHAYAGHSAEAAEAFARAAQHGKGPTRLILQSRVANQLLLSAQISRGLEVARDVLAEVRVRLPLRPVPALAMFLWEHLRFSVSRLFNLRPSPERRARMKLALRVIRELHRSIPLVHTPAFIALTAQHLRVSASVGGPHETSWTHSIEGWLRAVRRPLQEAQPLLDLGREMSLELADTESRIAQSLAEGSAYLLHWELERADACFERAHEMLERDPASRVSDLIFTRFQLGTVWYLRGRNQRLVTEMAHWLAEVRERGDALGLYLLLGPGHGFLGHLMRDDPDAALAELEGARLTMAQEPVSSTFAHVGFVIAVQTCFAYKGGHEGLQWRHAHHHTARSDATLGGQLMRQANALCRMMGHAAALAAEPDEARGPHLRQLERDARSLLRSRSHATRAMAEMAMAQLDAYHGRLDSARRRVRDARRALGDQGRALIVRLDYLEGLLEGGTRGRELRARAIEELAGQGWTNPERALGVGIPLAQVLQERGEL